LAVLAFGWLALVASADSFLTQRSLKESQSAVVSRDFTEGADRASDAIALQPWAAEPRLQLALVYESAGDLEQASREAAEASERAPDDWLPWLARARIETAAGNIEAARLALDRARSLNPKAPFLAGSDAGAVPSPSP